MGYTQNQAEIMYDALKQIIAKCDSERKYDVAKAITTSQDALEKIKKLNKKKKEMSIYRFNPKDRGELVIATNKNQALKFYKETCGQDIIEDMKDIHNTDYKGLKEKAIKELNPDQVIKYTEDISKQYLKGEYTIKQIIDIYLEKGWEFPAIVGWVGF